MSNIFHWIRRPPSMMLAALFLVLLTPVGRAPQPRDPGSSCAANGGRIAVAVLGEYSGAEISALAGRAPYFLLFQDSEMLEVVPNEFANADRSAGARAAYRLSELGVECLVAGAAGARMRSVLAAESISFFEAEGTATLVVSEIARLDAGALR